jgi:hypothetical protein
LMGGKLGTIFARAGHCSMTGCNGALMKTRHRCMRN